MSDLVPSLVLKVRAAWGERLPPWVEALAMECAASSQNKIATRLGRSSALVSQVLGNKYPGDLKAVEDVFNGVFRAEVVTCPAQGTLPLNECHDWRRKARRYINTTHHRAMMYRACHACPRNQREVTDGETATKTLD